MVRFSGWIAVLALVFVWGCSSKPEPTPIAIGSQVDFSLLEDQHGNAFPHQSAMHTVLFVNSMQGNALIREALNDVDVACMAEGRVVYLADISGMPRLISSLIAVPRMRDYPYPVWLDRNGLATDALPQEEDAVTVLSLKESAVEQVEHVRGKAALYSRLLQDCAPAAQQVAAAPDDTKQPGVADP